MPSWNSRTANQRKAQLRADLYKKLSNERSREHQIQQLMHTQIGIFAKHLPRATPEQLFDAIAGFGFNCAQFNAACLGIQSLPDAIDGTLWRRTARAARSAGVKVVALSATFNLLDENRARLRDNFRRLELLAQGATILGTDLVTLCTGTRNQQDMWTGSRAEAPGKWQPFFKTTLSNAAQIRAPDEGLSTNGLILFRQTPI